MAARNTKQEWECPICGKRYKYNRKAGCSKHKDYTPLIPVNSMIREKPAKKQEKPAKKQEKKKEEKKEKEELPDEDEDDEDILNEIESERIRLNKRDKTGKMLTKSEFRLLFHAPFDWLNRYLVKVPPEAKYYELAQIWIITDDEIDQLSDLIYGVLAKYVPRFLIWLGGEGFFTVIAFTLALLTIFGGRIIKTIKFFHERKKKKELKESEGNK